MQDTGHVNLPYCHHCTGFHYPSTSKCGTWYSTGMGYAVIVPDPKEVFIKTMPCGHTGILIMDKWVCQTCMGWELAKRCSQMELKI